MLSRFIALSTLVMVCAWTNADETSIPQTEERPSQSTEEAITIPLEKIWSTEQEYFGGMDVPKTRQIAKLEGDPRGAGPLVNAIRRELDISIRQKADQAFVVEGTDLEALKNAHAVLVGKQPRPTAVPKDRAVSIVFFSLNSPYYTSLTDVKRQGNTIEVRYELIPHIEDAYTDHLSLIPLGKLAPGHYEVNIDHEPYEKRFSKFGKKGPNESLPNRMSTSFEFDVK